MTMSCSELEAEIGEYADGTLDQAGVERVKAHMTVCAACRALASDFMAIRATALSLERQVPSAQVWPRIAAAVEAERRQPWWRALLTSGGFGWTQALAGAVMVVLLAGGTWMASRQVASVQSNGRSTPVTATGAAPGRGNAPTAEPSAAGATAATSGTLPEEEHYTATASSLEAIAKAETNALDTETAAVLNANLTNIDRAIGETRAALQTEPSSEVAYQSLLSALRSKVAVLQETVALINEMRQGDQEGAARIVSGIDQ